MSHPENDYGFIEELDADNEIERNGQEVILLDELYKLQSERSRWGNADPARLATLRRQIAFTYFCLSAIDEIRARRYTPAYNYMQAAEPYRTDSHN